MPFQQQNEKPFTRARVGTITPVEAVGVYGLYRSGRWVYVGRGMIRDRLMAHLNGDNPCITREAPTHWVDEITADHVARERVLIVELTPACNQQVG